MPFSRNERAFGRVFNHQSICVSNHCLKLLKRLPLAHHGGHLFQTANIPTVISPILERKLFHRVQLNSAALKTQSIAPMREEN